MSELQGGDLPGVCSVPVPGDPEDPIIPDPEEARELDQPGTPMPEQGKDDLSGVNSDSAPGSSKNPINLDQEAVREPGTLVPEQGKGDGYFSIPGAPAKIDLVQVPVKEGGDLPGVCSVPVLGDRSPQNPIYMDLGRVSGQAEQIRVDCVPEQLWDDFSKHHIDGKAQAAHTIFVLPPGTCGVRPGNLPLVATGATDGRFRRRPRGLSLEA